MPPIEIRPYRVGWPSEFRAVGAGLRQALGPLALAINHIGSTSVPGLDAKDVIDVQVSVRALDAEALRPALGRAGYTLRDDIARDHVPSGEDPAPERWSKLMAVAPEGARRTHIHLRVRGRPNERYPLLFRDFLRATPAAAGSYALIKRELAARHADDVDSYYAVKDPACDLIMVAAEPWATATGWTLPPSDA